MEAQPAPMSYSARALSRAAPGELTRALGFGKFARHRKTRKRALQREGTAFAKTQKSDVDIRILRWMGKKSMRVDWGKL